MQTTILDRKNTIYCIATTSNAIFTNNIDPAILRYVYIYKQLLFTR